MIDSLIRPPTARSSTIAPLPSRRPRRLARLWCAVLLGALTSGDLRADELLLHNGRSLSGITVVSETYETIKYRKRGLGSAQSETTSDVREVRYSKLPPDLRAAEEARAQGNLLGAAELLVEVASDEDVEPFHRANALISAGDSQLAAGSYAAAVTTYDRLLTDFPKTRHLGRALSGKGRAALMSRQFDTAEEAFETLRTEAADKGLGDQWPMEAEFWGLYTSEARGEKSGLVAKYGGLRDRAAGTYQDIANKCALRMGRVQFDAGKVPEAADLFQEIIDNRLVSEAEVVAGAFNGRGRCYFAQAQQAVGGGDAVTASEQYRLALFDFLRVHVSYPDVPKEQPEALYWAAESFKNLPDIQDASTRARALLQRCKTYTGSPWAEKAAQS